MRQKVADRYTHLLRGIGISTTPWIDSNNLSAWAQYTIRIQDRDAVQKHLHSLGIPTAVHYPIPLNKQPAVEQPNVRLPVGDLVSSEVVSLPMYPELSLEDQECVVNGLRDICI